MHEPFIFGPKSILPALLRILEGDSPTVSPMDFFHLMTIARFLDDYTLVAMYGIDEANWPPEPDTAWIKDGWDGPARPAASSVGAHGQGDGGREMKPGDFMRIGPMNSVRQVAEAETVARSIMIILARNGNEWRSLSWSEYEVERRKDGHFTMSEQSYFDDVVDFTVSEQVARLFSPFWKAVTAQSDDAAQDGGNDG